MQLQSWELSVSKLLCGGCQALWLGKRRSLELGGSVLAQCHLWGGELTIKYCRNVFAYAQLGYAWDVSETQSHTIVTTWLKVFRECCNRQIFLPPVDVVLSLTGRLSCFVTKEGDPYPHADDADYRYAHRHMLCSSKLWILLTKTS